MSSDAFVVKISHLSKCYRIYDRPEDRLKDAVIPRVRRVFGKTTLPYYREFWALQDISCDIRRGDTVGIIGRNGSGKSTLLQIISGTLTPTGGSVETNGRIAALLELGAGFNPEFTGRENVYLNASVLGLSRPCIDNRLDLIAGFADIGDFFDRPVKMYSSGMYVRLAFAIAAHVEADVLIVDEALSVGDMVFQHKCIAKIRRMLDDGLTLLFVSHDPDAVRALCRHALWLHGGILKLRGAATDVSRAYFEDSILAVNRARVSGTKSDARAPERAAAETDGGLARALQDATRDLQATRALEVGAVRIIDAQGREVEALPFGEEFRLQVTVRALVALDNVNVSFVIKDHLGIELTGESLFNKERRGLRLAEGEGRRVSFTGTMYFRGGVTYSISLRVNMVARWDRTDLIHLFSDDTAAVFRVVGDPENPVWYRIYQPFEIAIEDAS